MNKKSPLLAELIIIIIATILVMCKWMEQQSTDGYNDL